MLLSKIQYAGDVALVGGNAALAGSRVTALSMDM